MTEFSALLQQGVSNAWLFIPSAVALGALHGLEPGHSKTMMAAFIVAVRGTPWQAVLLGMAATVSHTAVVWAVALAGLHFGREWDAQASEPWLQMASGLLMIAVAAWMVWRLARPHGHGGRDHAHAHAHVHAHDHSHAHAHAHDPLGRLVHEAQDDHERFHALDIQKRFAGRQVTTGEIVVFGLTGGLIPCPASITVLLLCLQLRQFALGATLVLSFSVGLALTMVASGVLAALSVRHAARRWRGFGEFARKAPFASAALIALVGAGMVWMGASALPGR